MKKRKIAIVGLIILIWIGIVGFLMVKSKGKENEAKNDKNSERYIIPEEKKIFLNGVVQPTKSKTFYKDVTKGENYTIHKENGENVNKGSLLITYENDEISSQISDLKDQISDLKSGNKNEEVQADIKEQIKSLEKDLSKLKNKKYSYEYAPFAGQVFISKKDMNVENQELLKIRSIDFNIKSQVSERELEKIKEDQKVDILILANDKKTQGTIAQISNEPEAQEIALDQQASPNTSVSNYPITINLQSKANIENGYHVQINIKLSNNKFKIPTSAIKEDGNKKYVYLIKDNKLVKQFIQAENKEDKFSEVISGLKEKDEIIKTITSEMKEGQVIE
ncbi:HlyD family efflux transporter periplasmic adaptor subunit [Romboutsia sedimentorum]|uniref:efflux RND transporter periplasmic adaptor subunit n=1 Tax=Romboutsia sedimentorum TaxID=1368474 RepID=UPI0024DE919D|nr:HlyD family efflux transporter periplasmic adaptor subunit [Romboutsia sedimentorum]MDK2587118.1 HlyD family efflux transporter periplasmic adaptor subunit [Romboutsia sedimentorum]